MPSKKRKASRNRAYVWTRPLVTCRLRTGSSKATAPRVSVQAVGRVGEPHTGSLPLPTIRVEVTKAGFLPIADSIVAGLSGWVIGNQTAKVGVAFSPGDEHRGREPTRFFENVAS